MNASSSKKAGRPSNVTIICNDADYFLRHRRAIADRLAEQGNKVKVMTGGRPITHEIGDWAFRHIEIERFSFHPIRDARLALLTIRESVGRRLDALHLITLKPAVIGGLAAIAIRALTGYPRRIVVTVAGLGRLMASGSDRERSLARRLTEWAIRRLGKRKDVFFTFETAHDRAQWLERGLITQERSIVLRGAGVDPSTFFTREGQREAGPLRVLFASRLLRSKGLDAFLLAAEAFSGRADVEFIVAGMTDVGDPDGYSPQELEANRLIRFLGAVSDMPSLLRSVDVVCLPSRYGEGIPRILIEAAACGVPMIASDLEGCREVVVDGETGFVVASKPVARTAEEIGRALDDYAGDPLLLPRHAAAARKRFGEGGFGEAEVTGKIVDLLLSR